MKIEELQQSCLYNLVLPAWALLIKTGLEGRELSQGAIFWSSFIAVCSDDSYQIQILSKPSSCKTYFISPEEVEAE